MKQLQSQRTWLPAIWVAIAGIISGGQTASAGHGVPGPPCGLFRYQITVHMVLFADYVAAHGGPLQAEAEARSILNGAAMLLQDMPLSNMGVNVKIVGSHVFGGTDPFTNSTDSAQMYSSVTGWRTTNINTPLLGAVFCFTSRNMLYVPPPPPGPASILEFVPVSTACSNSANAILTDYNLPAPSGPFMRVAAAHVIGHLVGMNHDPGPSSPYVMSPTINPSATTFSAATINQFNVFFNTHSSCFADFLGPGADGDSDGMRTECDNCPTISNSSQSDHDADGVGDACDCLADIAPLAGAGGDHSVNVSDLLLVINSWGPCSNCPLIPCAADVSPSGASGVGDCQVNVSDLLAIINAWGPCP